MAWQTTAPVTAHTCGGPVWGRKTPGCPRCDELLAGAEPVRWVNTTRADDARRSREIAEHFAPGGRHSRGACGPVCTFGDW